jgi:hypothetical protein
MRKHSKIRCCDRQAGSRGMVEMVDIGTGESHLPEAAAAGRKAEGRYRALPSRMWWHTVLTNVTKLRSSSIFCPIRW